jgi:hypothetical protein
MKKHVRAIAIVLGLTVTTEPASAQSTCSAAIKTESSQSSLTNSTDGVTPDKIRRSYNAAFARGRAVALAAWTAKIRQECHGRSTRWSRSRDQKIEACDQAMGGRFTVCVSAVPGKK